MDTKELKPEKEPKKNKKSNFLLKIIHLFPNFIQSKILQVGFLQRSQTYITDLPGMLPMLTNKGKISSVFKKHLHKLGLADAESVFITMDGEVKLHALYMPPKNGKLICAFHGIKGNWLNNPPPPITEAGDERYNPKYRMELLKEFAQDGFGFLAFSLPGFNPSQGTASEKNFNKACDVFANYTIEKISALNLKARDVIVCGESLGGAIAAILAKKLTEKHYPPSVLSLIATFDSLISMTQNEFPNFSNEKLEHILKEKLDTTKVFESLNPKETYIHIAAAKEDNIIPASSTEKLLLAAKTSQNGKFNVLYHNIDGRHTTWNKNEVLQGYKTAFMAREEMIEISGNQAIHDIKSLLGKKKLGASDNKEMTL